MSTSQSHSHSLEGNAHGTPVPGKVAISSGIGATIEAYDFIGYGTAAALYFGTYFFPVRRPADRDAAVLRARWVSGSWSARSAASSAGTSVTRSAANRFSSPA